jgi:hypothetical protein
LITILNLKPEKGGEKMDKSKLEARKASQDYIRNLLNNYLRCGRKARYIASEIDVDESVISKFRKRSINLYAETFQKLEDFLMKV